MGSGTVARTYGTTSSRASTSGAALRRRPRERPPRTGGDTSTTPPLTHRAHRTGSGSVGHRLALSRQAPRGRPLRRTSPEVTLSTRDGNGRIGGTVSRRLRDLRSRVGTSSSVAARRDRVYIPRAGSAGHATRSATTGTVPPHSRRASSKRVEKDSIISSEHTDILVTPVSRHAYGSHDIRRRPHLTTSQKSIVKQRSTEPRGLHRFFLSSTGCISPVEEKQNRVSH